MTHTECSLPETSSANPQWPATRWEFRAASNLLSSHDLEDRPFSDVRFCGTHLRGSRKFVSKMQMAKG